MDQSAVARFLGAVARLDRLALVAGGTLPVLAASLVVVVCAMLIDARYPIGAWPRTALAIAFCSVLVWFSARMAIAAVPARGAKRRDRLSHAARMSERRLGIPDSVLINAVQLTEANSPGARAAIIRLHLRALQAIDGVTARSIIQWRVVARRGAVVLGLLALIATAGLAFPRFVRLALPRFVAPLADHPAFTWTDFTMSVEPIEVTRGENARVRIGTSGALPQSLRLMIRDERGSSMSAIEMTPEPVGERKEPRGFAATLLALQEPVWIFAAGDTGESQRLRIAPVPRPRLLAATVRALRDGSAEADARPLAIGDAAEENRFAVAPGTTVEIRIECSIPPQRIESHGGTEVMWRAEGLAAIVSARVEGQDATMLTLRAVSAEGLVSRDAVSLRLEPAESGVAGRAEGPTTAAHMLSVDGGERAAAAPAGSANGGEQSHEMGSQTPSNSDASRSSPAAAQGREQTPAGASQGVGGSGRQGLEGVVADGAVPRSDSGSGATADGALRSGDADASVVTRTGTGQASTSDDVGGGPMAAQVPEAYRALVGRYFSIVGARERAGRTTRNGDAPAER